MKVAVTRVERFNAAHRLYNPNWSEEENTERYGLCSLPNYHGHNYKLEVTVTGEIDADSGYVIDLKDLKAIIKGEVSDRFDHKNLNLDTEEFKNKIPTAENIAVVIYDLIKSKLPAHLSLHIKLYETERNVVSYPAG